MDAIKALIVRHLKDPTTYAGLAAILLTYLPASVTGIDASQWQQAIAGIVGLALIWIDGRMNATKIEATGVSDQKGFATNTGLIGVIVLGLIAVAMSGCAPMSLNGASDPAAVAKAKANVQWACFAGNGVLATVMALSPVLQVKARSDGDQAIQSLQSALNTACDPNKPIDPTNIAQDYANLMSLTGQVAVIVAKANTPPTSP